MERSAWRGRWLLLQIGFDGDYYVVNFSQKSSAEREGKRDHEHGIPYYVYDLDILTGERPNDVDLAKIGYYASMRSFAEQMEMPEEMIQDWGRLSTGEMMQFTAMAEAIRKALGVRREDDVQDAG